MAALATTPARSDSAIREDVALELKYDPKITSPDIAVAVKDGVVTLSGFASTYLEKDAAASTRTDPELARDVTHELQSHVSIPADRIKATDRNGWVTLEGAVDWQYQKTLAESAVKKLKGVIGLTNSIQVKPAVTATEVKSKIEEALKRS